jgi:hypothetical protein
VAGESPGHPGTLPLYKELSKTLMSEVEDCDEKEDKGPFFLSFSFLQ